MIEKIEKTEFKHIMTVDVEDWFSSSVDLFKEANSFCAPKPNESVVKNTLNCLKLLKETNSKATFFVLTTVCEHYPDVIREIFYQGHEIGVHGYDHRLLYNLTEGQFRCDLDKSLSFLAKCGITDIKGYRAPYWSITRKSLWVIDVLKEYNFLYDSSIFPIKRRLYGIHDFPTEPFEIRENFWEIPPTTIKIFNNNVPIAGGGYLRLFPLSIIMSITKKMQKMKKIGVFYFHPYELDNSDVMLQVRLKNVYSILNYAQQILGRNRNVIKLETFIKSFQFMDIATALNEIKEM